MPKSIQERLGYEKDAKLLIIHADDFGLSHSQNIATIQVLENATVNSVSVMPPCPWFFEAMIYAQHRPNLDLGIHLTLTCEWPLYKWGPVSSPKDVSSLLDKNGFFDNIDSLVEKAKLGEIEIEIRAQIEKTLRFGVNVTHIDCHMLFLFRRPEFIELYARISQEYKLPFLISQDIIESQYQDRMKPYLQNKVDLIFIAETETFEYGFMQSYEYVLRALPPGLNVFLIHPAFDDLEMQGIAAFDQVDFGAKWRQQDFNFFASDLSKKIIKEENIHLINWGDIKKVMATSVCV